MKDPRSTPCELVRGPLASPEEYISPRLKNGGFEINHWQIGERSLGISWRIMLLY